MTGSGRLRKVILRVLRVLALAVAISAVLIPLAYLVLNSLKLQSEMYTIPPIIIPSRITFEHFQVAFDNPRTVRFLTNSLIVTSVTTGITVVVSTLAAYGLARLGLRARYLSLIVFIFLFIRFYPRITTVIPYFLVMREFGLLDTVWAIIIGHLGITIPFVTWLMLIVFQDLPREVEEAAMVDGANPLQRFWRVALPMAAPGVASAAILTAFLSWNERRAVGAYGSHGSDHDCAHDPLRSLCAALPDPRHHAGRRQGLVSHGNLDFPGALAARHPPPATRQSTSHSPGPRLGAVPLW
jgi:multiple sugar transport system permease protein